MEEFAGTDRMEAILVRQRITGCNSQPGGVLVNGETP